MRPLVLAPEPSAFDVDVRQRGLKALNKRSVHLAQPVPSGFDWSNIDHWRRALDDLAAAYGRICCYSCFRVHPDTGAGSVDHFEPKSLRPDLAYEWNNFRFMSSRFNSRKGDNALIDPIGLRPGTFVLSFVDFEVGIAEDVPAPLKSLASLSLDVLQLNAPVSRDERKRWFGFFKAGQIAPEILRQEAPFIYEEAVRQGLITDEA